MTDYTLEQIVAKARDARDGGEAAWRCQSTGEKLAVALVLNRPDWLAVMDYTLAEAIERVGADWLARVPVAAKIIRDEKEN